MNKGHPNSCPRHKVLGQGSGQRGPSLDLTVVHIGSNAIALKIQHSQGGGAFYRRSTDTIHLPSREQFKKAAVTTRHGAPRAGASGPAEPRPCPSFWK